MKRVSNQVQGEMQVGPSENIENGMGQLIRLSHGPVCSRRMVLFVQDVLPIATCLLHAKSFALYHFTVFLYCFH